jgi:hypothetical protein
LEHVPQTPLVLKTALTAIFPSFSVEEPEVEELVYEPPLTFHRVMIEFASFFSRGVMLFSSKQLQRIAELIVVSTKHTGPLENAIDTCFLEHTRQLKVNRQLAPWLAKARAKCGA